jgi:hypothetical protein
MEEKKIIQMGSWFLLIISFMSMTLVLILGKLKAFDLIIMSIFLLTNFSLAVMLLRNIFEKPLKRKTRIIVMIFSVFIVAMSMKIMGGEQIHIVDLSIIVVTTTLLLALGRESNKKTAQ